MMGNRAIKGGNRVKLCGNKIKMGRNGITMEKNGINMGANRAKKAKRGKNWGNLCKKKRRA